MNGISHQGTRRECPAHALAGGQACLVCADVTPAYPRGAPLVGAQDIPDIVFAAGRVAGVDGRAAGQQGLCQGGAAVGLQWAEQWVGAADDTGQRAGNGTASGVLDQIVTLRGQGSGAVRIVARQQAIAGGGRPARREEAAATAGRRIVADGAVGERERAPLVPPTAPTSRRRILADSPLAHPTRTP